MRGLGQNLHGQTSIGQPGGKREVILILTLGYLGPDKKLIPLRTLADYVKAELSKKPMLAVELHGSNLAPKPENSGQDDGYSFAGRFTGQEATDHRSMMIVGQEADEWLIPVLLESVAK